MNGGDNSLIGGLISASTLVGLNFLVGRATFRSKKLEALIEGQPQVLIHHGKLIHAAMDLANLTHHELNSALRQAGCSCVDEVQWAVIENNGSISVIPRRSSGASLPLDQQRQE
jgi:uncharacterized membrane protein YcaP (DUF421 family)